MINPTRPFVAALSMLLLLASCQPSPNSVYQSTSLLEYGIPITVLAPDSISVAKEDWVVQQSISLRNEQEMYFVQIWIREAEHYDVTEALAEKLADVKEDRGFSKIIAEDTDGFIFERTIDSSTVNFDFRHVQVKGDKEYTFQTDLTTRLFSEAQIRSMYDAVRNVSGS
jgi:hypothetical protein